MRHRRRVSVRLATLLALAIAGTLLPVAAHAQTDAAALDTLNSRADQGRYRGAETAPVTIFEFSDFQCPFCGNFERMTFAALDSAFLKTGKARLIYFNLPLTIHANSWVAAEAAMCASGQGKFWPMHELLFARQKAWESVPSPDAIFAGYAAEIGVDGAAFAACTAGDQVARVLLQDLTFAIGNGVGSTPTFVILREPKEGENPELAQRVLSGAAPFGDFAQAIAELSGGQ